MSALSEQRRLAAIMFTDMVGYSALAQCDDTVALELLQEHRQILRGLFGRFDGREVKTIGDAFLVEFPSALSAANCAVEIQRHLAKRNHDVAAGRQVEVRIGIHIGDVVHREDDVYGDGVNIASRIQPLARPGGICLSMDVERQIRNALALPLEKLAATELKNIRIPMDVFRVVLPWEKTPVAIARKRSRTAAPIIIAGGIIALLAAAFWFWLANKRGSPSSAATPSVAKSVAVLPFVNMSPDKENEYLSDGITEDLCTALTQIKTLHVPARTSSFAFKGKTEDIRKIGEQLNVATVLEGSVSKAGNKLRIAAQLINVADGYHLWAANYDREMTDILEIRSDISRQVVDALKVQLGLEETQRLTRKPTETTEAYQIYLLGRYELNKFTETGFIRAIEHFKHAVELDHSFALANAGLAEAYNILTYFNYVAPTAGFPEAKRAAERALELDPGLAEGHSALGFVLFEYEWQYEAGEREFIQAIRLNPNSATAHLSYGEFLLDLGRFPEALQQFEEARKSDPLSVRLTFDLGAWHWFKQQLEPAVAETQKGITMDPTNSLSYHMLGYILLKMNKPAEAVDAWEKANTFEGVFTAQENAELRNIYVTEGTRAFLRKEAQLEQKWREQGKYRSPLFIALHYAAAGDHTEALRWLERAVEERAGWLPELKMEPTWEPVRSNPRFIALLKKVGLEK